MLPIRALHGIKRHLSRKFVRNYYSLATFLLLNGEALERSLGSGDKLRVSRDAGGGLSYTVTWNSDKILSAGAVGGLDRGGPIAICQDYDNHPNPNAEVLQKPIPGDSCS